MSYPRSAYKNPFGNVSPNGAQARGWGLGWPNCQVGKMKTVSGGNIRVTVRAEIAELVANLLSATDKVYNVQSGSTGAYNCRPIAGTNTASNHSWGLAVDINWNDNPQTSVSGFHSQIPPAVVAMWNDCGFFWGGFYQHSSDTMHFEYIRTPGDVKADTARAKKHNGVTTPTPAPKPPVTPSVASVVALGVLSNAAKQDPGSKDGKPNANRRAMVLVVEKALVAEGLLKNEYADGLFGTSTVTAYKNWQKKIGYSGADADGLPGLASLKKLGNKHKFEVVL